MKAAKAEPTADLIAEATVVLDYVLSKFAIEDASVEVRSMIARVTRGAIGEYLRLYKRARVKSPSGYVMIPDPTTREWDFQCVFCRASLNTLAMGPGGYLPRPFLVSIERHTTECAAAMLVGRLIPKGPPKENRRRRESSRP